MKSPAHATQGTLKMRVAPLYFIPEFTDSEIEQHECSDRIWLSRREFEAWVTSSEVGTTTILRLSNGIDNSLGSVFGMHHSEDDLVYVPSWMYEILHSDYGEVEDEVTAIRTEPSLCTGLLLQPHTSDHISAPDPQELLRLAFEMYTCLSPGQTIPLWIGHHFMVTIVALRPRDEPVCIRNCEVVLELMPPLDMPIPVPPVAPPAAPEPESPVVPPPVAFTGAGRAVGGASIGTKSRREAMAEAALRRIRESKP
jgi:hypothetical protein